MKNLKQSCESILDWAALLTNEELAELRKDHGMGLTYALGYSIGEIKTLGDEGKERVINLFDHLGQYINTTGDK